MWSLLASVSSSEKGKQHYSPQGVHSQNLTAFGSRSSLVPSKHPISLALTSTCSQKRWEDSDISGGPPKGLPWAVNLPRLLYPMDTQSHDTTVGVELFWAFPPTPKARGVCVRAESALSSVLILRGRSQSGIDLRLWRPPSGPPSPGNRSCCLRPMGDAGALPAPDTAPIAEGGAAPAQEESWASAHPTLPRGELAAPTGLPAPEGQPGPHCSSSTFHLQMCQRER